MTTFLGDKVVERLSENREKFPDGQPHICLKRGNAGTIKCRLQSSDDIIKLALFDEVMARNGVQYDLRVYYLMGMRMDRFLSPQEPYSLKAICGILNNMSWSKISVCCPHSNATSDLLRNYDYGAEYCTDTFYDLAALRFMGCGHGHEKVVIRNSPKMSFCFPDLGAQKRFSRSALFQWWPNASLVTLNKHRDERTGIIEGIEIVSGRAAENVLIIDDLCDGGRTFVEAAKCFPGSRVGLAVVHGIFSNGLPLEGIDFVASTNSFLTDVVPNYRYEYV